jgi:hypothetical protein
MPIRASSYYHRVKALIALPPDSGGLAAGNILTATYPQGGIPPVESHMVVLQLQPYEGQQSSSLQG